MGLFGKKSQDDRRAEEKTKIWRTSKGPKDPYGFKALKRDEERARLFRRSD